MHVLLWRSRVLNKLWNSLEYLAGKCLIRHLRAFEGFHMGLELWTPYLQSSLKRSMVSLRIIPALVRFWLMGCDFCGSNSWARWEGKSNCSASMESKLLGILVDISGVCADIGCEVTSVSVPSTRAFSRCGGVLRCICSKVALIDVLTGAMGDVEDWKMSNLTESPALDSWKSIRLPWVFCRKDA